MNDFLGMNAHLYKSISSRNSIKVLYSNVCHIGSNILHFSLKHFSHYFRLMYVCIYCFYAWCVGVFICMERGANCSYGPADATHTRLTALCPELPGWAGTRKVKPIWILLKQETVSGSGISWAICKSALPSRQIVTPAPHHSVFYMPDALPAVRPTASKHWRLVQLMPLHPKTPSSLASFKSRPVYVSGTGVPRLSWKRRR